MSNTTTRETYETARNRRAEIAPLNQGKYKLAEAQNTLGRLVCTVQATLGMPTKLQPLCMPHEAGRWAKKIPTLIADILGYTVMPAMKALEGDGLSRKQAASLGAVSQTIVDNLLADAEAVRCNLPPHGLPDPIKRDLLSLAENAASAVDSIGLAVKQVSSSNK